jgi:carboxyl-terminal processing protease
MKIQFHKKAKRAIAIATSIIMLGIISTLFTGFDDNKDFETTKNLDIYFNLFKNLNSLYVDKIDPAKMIQTSIDEMLKSLDPYTVYIPESKMEDFKFMTTGEYGGLGASIKDYNGSMIITDVYENYPAQKAGIVPGDIIISIDGKNVEGRTTDQISELLKGQSGTTITMSLRKPTTKTIVEKKITREQIKIESVPYTTMVDKEIGYMILSSFTENSGEDVKKAFIALKAKGAKSVIFDLRDNPGGLLMESIKICNLFVPKGKEIVSTRGKYATNNAVYTTNEQPIDSIIPIAILVSSGSASASEIVSGSMQDLDRAVIIGERTYGKGLVQTTCDLTYNTKLKVTTAKYYIPSGRCIQALDYSHRNADGSVGKVPDSLLTEFKTKHGRSVYNGGGILPDIGIKEEEFGNIVEGLIDKNIIFDFVTKFQSAHKSIDSVEVFTLSDVDYSDFVTFAKSKQFDFQSETDKQIKALEDDAKNESYLSSVKDEIDALKKKIANEKKNDFTKYKEQIKQIIGSEIASRYYYQKGRIRFNIGHSKDLKEAIAILKDKQRYNAILSGKEGTHLKK